MKLSKQYIRFGIYAIIMMSTILPGFSQKLDYRFIDSATYHNYTIQNWDSVIILGKLALQNQIDYYYLRMRMGEAYSAQEKYILSAKSFDMARAFNQSDPYANSYLYYSYLNSGKDSRANQLSRNFSDRLKQSLDIKIKPFASIDVFSGHTFSNNTSKNGDINLIEEPMSNFGQQLIIGAQNYMHIGLMLNLSPSFSLYAGGSFIDIAKTARYQYRLMNTGKLPPAEGPGGWINYRYSVMAEEYEESFDAHIKQYELYLNGKLQLDKGWAVNLFTNVLFIYTPIVNLVRYAESKMDTVRYHPINGHVQMFTYEEEEVEFIETDTSFVNWVAGFNLQKDFDIVSVNLLGTFSELSGGQQGQIGLSCFYYPLGSTHLYGKTGLTSFFEFNDYLGKDQRFIFHQMLGVKLFKKTWLEAEYTSGNLNNVNVKQAMVVHNLPEKINFIAGANLHIFATDKLEISLIYNYSDKNGFYRNQDVNNDETSDYTFNYQTQSIIGGLKWTF